MLTRRESGSFSADELPDVLKSDIRFVPVQNVNEVFDLVLEGGAAFESPESDPIKTEKPKTQRKIMFMMNFSSSENVSKRLRKKRKHLKQKKKRN